MKIKFKYMKKEDFIELTHNLYDLTRLFPNKEPLRYKIRRKGDEILAGLILFIANPGPSLKEKKEIKKDILKEIEILLDFFEVAKPQDWVSPDDISGMQEEYEKIRKAVRTVEISGAKKEKPAKENKNENPGQKKKEISLSDRQKKILETFKKGDKDKFQLSDFKEMFSEVSKRTIIRDLNKLAKKNLIKRSGSGPASFYERVK